MFAYIFFKSNLLKISGIAVTRKQVHKQDHCKKNSEYSGLLCNNSNDNPIPGRQSGRKKLQNEANKKLESFNYKFRTYKILLGYNINEMALLLDFTHSNYLFRPVRHSFFVFSSCLCVKIPKKQGTVDKPEQNIRAAILPVGSGIYGKMVTN